MLLAAAISQAPQYLHAPYRMFAGETYPLRMWVLCAAQSIYLAQAKNCDFEIVTRL